MELTWFCPQCGEEQRLPGAESATVLSCPGCTYVGLLPLDWTSGGHVERCAICGSDALYRQKDFNQRIGILILVAGAALAVFTRYLSLLTAAILDLVIYATSAEALVCYGCRARIRGHLPCGRHGRFDPRLEEAVRRGGRGRGSPVR